MNFRSRSGIDCRTAIRCPVLYLCYPSKAVLRLVQWHSASVQLPTCRQLGPSADRTYRHHGRQFAGSGSRGLDLNVGFTRGARGPGVLMILRTLRISRELLGARCVDGRDCSGIVCFCMCLARVSVSSHPVRGGASHLIFGSFFIDWVFGIFLWIIMFAQVVVPVETTNAVEAASSSAEGRSPRVSPSSNARYRQVHGGDHEQAREGRLNLR